MAEESQINIMRRLIQEMLEEQRAKIRAVEEEGLAELRAPRVVEVAKDVERLSETVEALRRFRFIKVSLRQKNNSANNTLPAAQSTDVVSSGQRLFSIRFAPLPS